MAVANPATIPAAAPAAAAGRLDGLHLDAMRAASVEVLPVILGIIPFGLAIGVAVADSTVSDGAGWAGSFLIFAGSAHLAAVTLLGAGASVATILLTVFTINARLLVYSASLGPTFRQQPRWFRWAAPYFLVDQLFALTWTRVEHGAAGAWLRQYYLAAGLLIGLAWLPAIGAGVLVGPVVPGSWQLSFATSALLTGLLVPALVNRPAWIAALTGASVAVALIGLPNGLNLVAGAVAGTIAGIVAERTLR